jgi:WD40 repeat protein
MEELERIPIGASISGITVSDDGNGGGDDDDDDDDDDDKKGTLFAACSDCTGQVIDLQTKEVVTLYGHDGEVRCILPCEDTDVLTCSVDKTIRRWNRVTGECIRICVGHSHWVNSIVYEKKTRRIFSASCDKSIMAWNADTGEVIGTMKGHNGSVYSIARLNSATIVSGSKDSTVRIWDTTTMTELSTMSSHTDFVYSVAATPDGEHIVSGSFDKTVKVWNIASGECRDVLDLSHHIGCVRRIAISPNGRFIAAGGWDSTFYLVKVAPSFPFVFLEDSELDSRLLSDGRLQLSNQAKCIINSSSRCTLASDNQVSLLNNPSDPSITLTAPTASSAQKWVEAINAVRKDLSRPIDNRSHSSKQAIIRYRFHLFQVINFAHQQSYNRRLLPKDVVLIIHDYIFSLSNVSFNE